jgi:hypothetical protein
VAAKLWTMHLSTSAMDPGRENGATCEEQQARPQRPRRGGGRGATQCAGGSISET